MNRAQARTLANERIKNDRTRKLAETLDLICPKCKGKVYNIFIDMYNDMYNMHRVCPVCRGAGLAPKTELRGCLYCDTEDECRLAGMCLGSILSILSPVH